PFGVRRVVEPVNLTARNSHERSGEFAPFLDDSFVVLLAQFLRALAVDLHGLLLGPSFRNTRLSAWGRSAQAIWLSIKYTGRGQQDDWFLALLACCPARGFVLAGSFGQGGCRGAFGACELRHHFRGEEP